MHWQDHSTCPVTNAHPFGEDLCQFLWDEKQLELLPDYGWLDGGCLILSAALYTWSGGQLTPRAWVFSGKDGLVVDHWVATVIIDCIEIVIDGDGVGTVDDLSTKMAYESSNDGWLSDQSAQFFADATHGRRPLEEANLWTDQVVHELTRRLAREFGSFDLDRLSLGIPDCDMGARLNEQKHRSLSI